MTTQPGMTAAAAALRSTVAGGLRLVLLVAGMAVALSAEGTLAGGGRRPAPLPDTRRVTDTNARLQVLEVPVTGGRTT